MTDKKRDYEADVYYDVWRSGRNPDAINFDRVDDNYYNGYDYSEAARVEIRRQDEKRQQSQEET